MVAKGCVPDKERIFEIKAAQRAKVSSAITVTDKEGVPQTSRIGLATCAAGAQYTIPPTLARYASDPRRGLRETLWGFLHIPAKRFNPDSGDDGASFAMLGQWPLSGRWLSD